MTPVSSGQVRIVVTKPQRQPYIQDISVSGSAPTTYTITATVNPANSGIVTGANTYAQGTQCTLTATANEGYQFVNWTKNGQVVSTNASYTFTVNENANYIANFELMTFSVTASVIPAAGGKVDGIGTYNFGQQCTLTAEPSPGFNFFNWVTDNYIYSTDASITFTVTEDTEFIANFSYINYEVLTAVDPWNGGIIHKYGDNHYGSEVTLTIEPAENFVFQNWTENGVVVSEEESFTFTLTDHHYFIAHLIDVTSVGENAQQTMNIYPNPVNDKLFIEAGDAISLVEIYNLTGAMVLSQECNSEKVDIEVSSLQSGIYFIKMMTNNTIETRRFVKE